MNVKEKLEQAKQKDQENYPNLDGLKTVKAEKVGTEVYITKEFDLSFVCEKGRSKKVKQPDIGVKWKITIEEVKEENFSTKSWYKTKKVQDLLKELREVSGDQELNKILDDYITPF